VFSEDDLLAIQRISQENLLDFLRIELRLAHTLFEVSRAYNSHDNKARALEMVRTAIHTVRYHEGKITDRAVWEEIHALTDELEKKVGKSAPEENGSTHL
jgi:hypothetical protein